VFFLAFYKLFFGAVFTRAPTYILILFVVGRLAI
jgi:hypothetical protein